MPSTRDIRRRIKSVKNTSQITKAMQMVASSKMQKAQQAAVRGRPFAEMANLLMDHAAEGAEDFTHPLLEEREVRKKAVIVVSTDKGLCGALNANLLRELSRYDNGTTQFVAVGRKAAQFLARTKRRLVAEYTYRDIPTFGECQAIAKCARELFINREADQVDIVFSKFINTLSQKPEVRQLLPLNRDQSLTTGVGREASQPEKTDTSRVEYLFEPGAGAVMEMLMSVFLDFHVMQVLLESKASEHSARMVAMKNATDNAKQLIKDLTLEYNKLRQANITKELLEISSAAMALG